MMTTNSKPDENQLGLMESTKMLQSLINKLLVYLEINKHIDWEKEQVSIGTLWQKVVELSSKEFVENRVVVYGKELVADIRIDVAKTAQALADILDNALIYSAPDKKVEVRILIDNHELVIAITDFGYGIPVKEQDKVFSEFFRATNASLGKNVGSGVSLYIAKKIINEDGGSVTFQSTENQGSTFRIKLPIAKS